MMKRDLVYLLMDEDMTLAFGNLKTLLSSIHAESQYSTVWRLLDQGKGSAQFGAFKIERLPVIRGPYTIR